jgi:metal-dependent HD superfamily phosphatase/phosphodiesterase
MKTEMIVKMDEKTNNWEYIDEYSYDEPLNHEKLPLNVPTGNNRILNILKDRVEKDTELSTLWKCSNVIAINRLGYSDHGKKHIEIVANNALRILKLITDSGVQPSCVRDYGLSYDDAEAILFLGACLHDIGHSIHRDNHTLYSVFLSAPLLSRILADIYPQEILTIVISEVLHCIAVHHKDSRPLTMEASVLRISDALDMAHGRTRLWDDANDNSNIHAVSAKAIDAVDILPGKEKPVLVSIRMSGSAGVFQIDELLRPKLAGSGMQDFVQIEAHVTCEKQIITDFVIG